MNDLKTFAVSAKRIVPVTSSTPISVEVETKMEFLSGEPKEVGYYYYEENPQIPHARPKKLESSFDDLLSIETDFRNWNVEFQEILERSRTFLFVTKTQEDDERAFLISDLCKDFASVASLYYMT